MSLGGYDLTWTYFQESLTIEASMLQAWACSLKDWIGIKCCQDKETEVEHQLAVDEETERETQELYDLN